MNVPRESTWPDFTLLLLGDSAAFAWVDGVLDRPKPPGAAGIDLQIEGEAVVCVGRAGGKYQADDQGTRGAHASGDPHRGRWGSNGRAVMAPANT